MRNADAYLKHLAAVPMFAACTRKELATVAKCAEELSLEPGDVLVREGERAHEFFVIVEGSAVVTRGSELVTTLGSGDWFGELALLDRAPRNATVAAATATRVMVLGEREFNGLLSEVPSLARSVLAGMARRLHVADAQLVH